MTEVNALDVYRHHLPPYRSLLNPTVQYDYRIHSFVPLSKIDVQNLSQVLERSGTFSKKPMKGALMNYRSLLSDVGRSISRIGKRSNQASRAPSIKSAPAPAPAPLTITSLPPELIDYIVEFIDDRHTMLDLMSTCKLMYSITKPHFYQHVEFTSTYRFAQFITYLRVNSTVGVMIESVDLSKIEPGISPEKVDAMLDSGATSFTEASSQALAGWRDWKFNNNPLYAKSQPVSSASTTSIPQVLTKTVSNESTASGSSRSLRFFKRRKRSRSAPPLPVVVNRVVTSVRPQPQRRTCTRPQPPILNLRRRGHPRINKFLVDYATAKDVPVGSIVHLINLCPNLRRLDMGNLTISQDYQICPGTTHKYQTFDTMNNYVHFIDSHVDILNGSMRSVPTPPTDYSSASSIISTFRPRYNSLLPPLQPIHDLAYSKRGDGRVFLSDLSVKSLNSDHLSSTGQQEVLWSASNRELDYINLSSMIWLTKPMAADFLKQFVSVSEVDEVNWEEPDLDDLNEEDTPEQRAEIRRYYQPIVIDLTDSGMYKSLPWAKRLDLRTFEGCKLLREIIEDSIPDPIQELIRRERVRRGRVGENYFG